MFFFFPAMRSKYIQTKASSYLVLVQKMKAQIFQGDMVICPECWEIVMSCDHSFQEMGDGHWGVQI